MKRTKLKRHPVAYLIPALFLLATLPGAAQQGDPIKAKSEEAFKIGMEAYIYGYPLVLMEATKQVSTNVPAPTGTKAPINQFVHIREFPKAQFKDVVSPNVDTLYSVAWLDLSNGPLILHLPDSKDRYYLMPILDAWTNVIASPGKRTTGTKAGDYAIVGPDWKGDLPKNVVEIKAPTNTAWVIGRTYCNGSPSDYQAVHAFQDGVLLEPLSALGKSYSPPTRVAVNPNVDASAPPQEQAFGMDAATFFKRLAILMKTNPPDRADAPILHDLARIGLVPGKDFDLNKLDPAVAQGLDRSVKAAQERIKASASAAGAPVNGWNYSLKLGSYGTDYALRAYVAMIGLGANLSKDALYPYVQTTQDGAALSGSNRYVIHFEKNQLPPVNAFWSVTLYDGTHYFVPNPLNRYALRSADPLAYNSDGSLDLYLQKDSPGKAKEANWLPAPPGDFNLVMRLYWPKENVLNGQWTPVPVRQSDTKLSSVWQPESKGG